MIQFNILIEEQQGKGLRVQRASQGGPATGLEIAAADTIRSALDECLNALRNLPAEQQRPILKVSRERGDDFCVMDRWAEYVRRAYDQLLPPDQAAQLKQAFYTGALVAYGMIKLTNRLGHDPDLQAATLQRIRSELTFYLNTRALRPEILPAPPRKGGPDAG